jgi:zinc-ribbon domain
MNCMHCNAPLIPEARFCRNCGAPVSAAVHQPASVNNGQANQYSIGDSPTVLPPSRQAQQPESMQSHYPPQTYQPTVAVSPHPGSMPSTGVKGATPPLPTRRRKNRLMQVLIILCISMLVLLLVLVAGWFAFLRPYLNGLAKSEINGVFVSAENELIPLQVASLFTSRLPVIITERDANNFIASNTSPSDPIQQTHLTMTPIGMSMDIQTYGFASTITGVPRAVNGQLVITDVTVQGIASLIMSPDELTAILNGHFHEAISSLHHQVGGVQLKNHEMDVQLR